MKQVKIVIFVPLTHTDQIRKVIGEAGAGVIGNYSFCSFSSRGTGRFTPQLGANPAIGQIGKPEQVEEERIEFVCERDKAKKIIEQIKKAHPYEEVAIDIYPLIREEEL
jgi:hypothetical protein